MSKNQMFAAGRLLLTPSQAVSMTVQFTVTPSVARAIAENQDAFGLFADAMLEEFTQDVGAVPWDAFELVTTQPPTDKTAERLLFRNSHYHVIKEEMVAKTPDLVPRCWYLSIRSVSNTARHDWRDFQRIKNELVGPEAEGIEIYPKESHLVDTANQFHLWVWEEPFELGLGFNERLVSEASNGRGRQRPFRADQRPADLAGPADMQARMDDHFAEFGRSF